MVYVFALLSINKADCLVIINSFQAQCLELYFSPLSYKKITKLYLKDVHL